MTDHGEMFKLQVALVTKVVPCLGKLYTHDILDSNTKFPVRIVSWLVGDNVSSL
jgi:hypothetical protein